MAEQTLDWSAEVDALIAFCSRSDPEFARTIRPASAADLDHVQALAGQPLPPEYRAWLEKMGRTPQQALGEFSADLIFGIEAITEFYTNPPIPVPRDAIYLWTVNEDTEMFLSTSLHADPRPVLLLTWGRDPESHRYDEHDRDEFVVATSLLACLYRDALTRVRFPALAHAVELREQHALDKVPDPVRDERRRSQVNALALQLGFAPLPHLRAPDPACFDRADAAIWFMTNEYAPDSMSLKGDDPLELQRLAQILADNLDLYILP